MEDHELRATVASLQEEVLSQRRQIVSCRFLVLHAFFCITCGFSGMLATIQLNRMPGFVEKLVDSYGLEIPWITATLMDFPEPWFCLCAGLPVAGVILTLLSQFEKMKHGLVAILTGLFAAVTTGVYYLVTYATELPLRKLVDSIYG